MYYERKIRKNKDFKFNEYSRNISMVKLEDLVKPLHEDYNLFRGILKLKGKEELIYIDVVIGKNRSKLHDEYEALFSLQETNTALFAPLYGFVKDKKLSFASGASASGLAGVAVGRSQSTLQNYLTSHDDDDKLVRNTLRHKRAHVGRAIINITDAALEKNVVLFGLSLDDLMYYDEDDSIKLFFTKEVYEIGSHFPDAFLSTVIIQNQLISIDSLLKKEEATEFGTKFEAAEVGVSSQPAVVLPAHAHWFLGTLLFELFVGRSLQAILCPSSDNSYTSALAAVSQSDMHNLISRHCCGAKNWLRRELLKKLLQVYYDNHPKHSIRMSDISGEIIDDSDHIEHIESDTYLEHTSDSTIFFFIEKRVPVEILVELLEENPKRASVINRDGLLPIQYALEMNSYPGLLVKLIELYPASLQVSFPPSNEGEVGDNLAIRAMKLSLSDDHIRVLLPHYMPIDLEGNAIPVEDHQFAWTRLVCHEKPPDLYVETMKLMLQKFRSHVKALAMSVDELSRPALNIATPLCKAEIVKLLYFLGRYEFKSGVAHQSATCIVRLAEDTLLSRDVALKFMKHKDQFEREVNVRGKGGFDEDYVIGYLEAMDGDEDPVLREECTAKGLGAYNYCLIMVEADRSMHAVIAHEHIAGKDWDQIRALCAQLTKAVHHVHSRGMIHGDIKPSNIMRADGRMVLIDFDACVCFQEGDIAGVKYSSAYIPPEMIYIDETQSTLQSKIKIYGPQNVNGGVATGDFQFPLELVKAAPSYDMWALGVTLFQLCSGKPLFLADNEDNISGDALIELHDWTDKYKALKLLEVTDHLARNLLSQLLHKNPERRLTAERTLHHSFLTGKKAARMLGEEPEYDLFISYRVAADAAHVERLYNMLTAKNITVWWDKVCLEPGKPWEEGFCNGLAKSRAFVPVMSREALNSRKSPTRQNFENLTDDSPCDNVLLEYRLALEMRAMGLIELIFPVMIGDKGDNSNIYSNYFRSGSHPTCKSVSVYSVEEKVREHLDRQGLGAPFSGFINIDNVVSKLLENQGGFIEGSGEEAFSNVVMQMDSMVRKSNLKYPTSKSTSKSILVDLEGLEDDELDGIKLEISNIVKRLSSK